MSQRTSGLYRLTQIPLCYTAFQTALGANRAAGDLVDSYIKPQAGMNVLDIGCGPASLLPFLGDVTYTGVDPNQDSIHAACQRHGDARATFIAGRSDHAVTLPAQAYDRVLAIGLLHHLSDDEVRELATIVAARLKPGGRFVAVDPMFASGQHWVARKLAELDAGQHVRTVAAYRDLLAHALPTVRSATRHNLLRIPYSHAISIADVS